MANTNDLLNRINKHYSKMSKGQKNDRMQKLINANIERKFNKSFNYIVGGFAAVIVIAVANILIYANVAGVGIFGLLSNLNISISYFNGIALLLIAVACLYAVLEKVSVYERFVNKVAKLFENKKIRAKNMIFFLINFFS